jgi:hypothetical protein
MNQEKSLLEMLEDASKKVNDYWVSRWEKIKVYDVVGYIDRTWGCLEYNLASPMPGFQVLDTDDKYQVFLKKPYIEVTFFWKSNKIAKKTPPKIEEINGFFPIDMPYLLGKDLIIDDLEKRKDRFNVDSEKSLTTMEEAIQKLAELRQKL